MPETIEKAPIPAVDIVALADDLQDKIEQARLASRDDPFGNPVLRVTLWLTRLMDSGELSVAAAGELVRLLGRRALRERAGRLAHYVGLERDEAAAFAAIARRQGEEADSFAAFRAAVERPRFGAVFTAHPTFGMQRRLAHALADLASGAVKEADLPLPVSDPEAQSFRALREAYYEAGSQIAHITGMVI